MHESHIPGPKESNVLRTAVLYRHELLNYIMKDDRRQDESFERFHSENEFNIV